ILRNRGAALTFVAAAAFFSCTVWALSNGARPNGELSSQLQEHSDGAMVQGAVRDPDQRAVPSATIFLETNAKAGQPLTARTDATGAYCFSALGPGTYTLRAEMAGRVLTAVNSFVLGK